MICYGKIHILVSLFHLLFFIVDAHYVFYFDSFAIFANLFFLFMGICADPGVPASVYLRYSKSYVFNKLRTQEIKSIT